MSRMLDTLKRREKLVTRGYNNVADGYAGAYNPIPTPHTHAGGISNARFHTFRLVRYGPTNQRTDKPTDRRTDKASYIELRVRN